VPKLAGDADYFAHKERIKIALCFSASGSLLSASDHSLIEHLGLSDYWRMGQESERRENYRLRYSGFHLTNICPVFERGTTSKVGSYGV